MRAREGGILGMGAPGHPRRMEGETSRDRDVRADRGLGSIAQLLQDGSGPIPGFELKVRKPEQAAALGRQSIALQAARPRDLSLHRTGSEPRPPLLAPAGIRRAART